MLGKNVGRKFDDGKPRWDLMPFACLNEVVKVLTFGAKKYDDNNWQQIEHPRDRYFAATLRHLTHRKVGEKYDEETGLHHIAHAICCLLFFLWFDIKEHNETISSS